MLMQKMLWVLAWSYTSRVWHCSHPISTQTWVDSPRGSAVTCGEEGTVTLCGSGMGERRGKGLTTLTVWDRAWQ